MATKVATNPLSRSFIYTPITEAIFIMAKQLGSSDLPLYSTTHQSRDDIVVTTEFTPSTLDKTLFYTPTIVCFLGSFAELLAFALLRLKHDNSSAQRIAAACIVLSTLHGMLGLKNYFLYLAGLMPKSHKLIMRNFWIESGSLIFITCFTYYLIL